MRTRELKEHLIDALAQEYELRAELQKFNPEIRYIFAKETIEAAWPEVVNLGICADGSHALIITPTPTSNILNCAIGRDFNSEEHHTDVNAIAQTGTLVNGVYAVAISFLVGGRLVGINPFYWMQELPMGIPAIVTLMLPKGKGSRAKVGVQGFRTDTGEALSRPANVLLVEIPPK